MYAIKGNACDTVKILLEYGADYQRGNCHQQTPLMYASYYGFTQLVEQLCTAGADCNATCNKGWTPLQYAVAYDTLTDEPLLLYSNQTSTPTKRILGNKQQQLCGSLYEKQLFNSTLKIDDPKEISLLAVLLKTVSSNQQDRSVETPTATSRVPCWITPSERACSVVELLINAGADVNHESPDGFTPVLLAIKNHNSDAIALLAQAGASMNATNGNNSTPLYAAVEQNKRELIEMIILYGGDVNQQDNCGRTPLHHAVIENKLGALTTLMQHNASTALPDACGMTPLDYARINNNHKAIKRLLMKKDTPSLWGSLLSFLQFPVRGE
jgi:ankyrin repeat protein